MKIAISIFKTFVLSVLIVAQVHFAYAQTASIIPPAKTTFFDANGNPLTSGTVDFYIPSTNTRKTTWQDAAETIPNTNPVVLDSAGRALILGSGSYRQVVKDSLNNIIWDQVTSSSGSGGSITTSTGDGDLVGTIKPWAGMTAPNQYAFTYGQEVSRTTYAALFTAITSTQAVFCTSGNSTITGIGDTTNFWIGMTVELSCVVSGSTTITAKTSSSVTLASIPNTTINANATFFPWGHGNGVTTFNLPDFRGIVPAGNNIMGGVASSNLTTTYFGSANPNSSGALGGNQSHTISVADLPANIVSTNATQSITVSTTRLIPSADNGSGPLAGLAANAVGGASANNFPNAPGGSTASWSQIQSLTGTNNVAVTSSNTGGGTISLVQPTKTVNYIIKTTPDANSATASGVTDINGMIGSIGCGSGLTCTGNTISSSGTIGPGSAAIGNMAFWLNTAGTSLGSAPAFQTLNPANAAIYSQLANIANGYTTVYNGMQFSLGTPIPASGQFGSNTVGVQQALVGTLSIASGDTTGYPGYAVMGYCNSNSGGGNTGCVGSGGFARPGATGTNASLWGANYIAGNNITSATGTGLDLNWLSPLELDINITQKSGAVEPTIGNVFGIYLIGSGDSTTNQGTGVSVNRLSIATSAKWNNAFEATAGAAVNALVAGPSAFSGISLASQPIVFHAIGGGGGTLVSKIFGDNSGGLDIQASTGSSVYLSDGVSNYLVTNPIGTGAKVQLPKLTAAGLVNNDASGNLATTSTGTGVQVALSANIGTAGSFIVNGGDAGTPSALVATNLSGTAASLTAGTATNATNTAITNDTTTNATMFPTWVATSSGNNQQKTTSTKLTFNPSNGLLNSTAFLAANDTTGGYQIKNAGGTSDAAFYEGPGGTLVFKMGTTNTWSLATNALATIIDYNNTNANALTVSPALWFWANSTADTAATDATLCRRTSNGQILTGTGTLGICLGTSGAQFKTAFAPMKAGLDEVMKINLQNYRYKPGYGDSGARMQYGATAQNVEAVLPDLAGHDEKGETINYDAGALLFIGLRSIQQLKADNDELRGELRELKKQQIGR